MTLPRCGIAQSGWATVDVIFKIGADQKRSLPWSLPQNRILTLIRWWGLDGVPNTPAIPTNSASHLSPPGFHADHVGQVTSFPKATLLIGKGLLQQAAAACAEAMPLRLLRTIRPPFPPPQSNTLCIHSVAIVVTVGLLP